MVIKFDDKKRLVVTVDTKIYQRESCVDSLTYILPLNYLTYDLSKFTWEVIYIDPAGTVHQEQLVIQEDYYADSWLQGKLPVDSKFTAIPGDVIMRINGVWQNPDDQKTYVLKSSSLTINIAKLKEFYDFNPEESLESLDQIIAQLNAKIQAVEELEDRAIVSMPDDLTLVDENQLHLSINGEPIGEGVEVLTSVVDVDDDNPTDGLINVDAIPIIEL